MAQLPEGMLDGLLREGLESFIPGGQEMLWQLGDAFVDLGRRLDSSVSRHASCVLGAMSD